MKLKVKATVAAALLGLVSLTASAVPLGNIVGNGVNWKMTGASTETSNYTAGVSETWSIGRITSIEDVNALPLWATGTAGDYLTYMLYGAVDAQINPGGTNGQQIYQTGATTGSGDGKIHLDVFLNSSEPLALLNALVSNRNGFGSFIGITDIAGPSTTSGIPYLQLILTPGISPDDLSTPLYDESTAQLYQDATAQTLPASGKGNFYAEVVGGSGATKWNTNGFQNGLSDFYAAFTLIPNTPNGVDANGNSIANRFAGKLNDPVTANAIPEPGSLALVGLALAAFGVIRRRDSKK